MRMRAGISWSPCVQEGGSTWLQQTMAVHCMVIFKVNTHRRGLTESAGGLWQEGRR